MNENTKHTHDTIAALGPEIVDDVILIKKIVSDAKATSLKESLKKHAPEIAREVKEDITAVRGALPVMKAGYKTTEFWLVAAVVLANILVPIFTGKALPIESNAAATALVGIYALIRGGTKAKATTAPEIPATEPSA